MRNLNYERRQPWQRDRDCELVLELLARLYDTHKANPSRAVAVSDVKARLAAAHKKVSAKA